MAALNKFVSNQHVKTPRSGFTQIIEEEGGKAKKILEISTLTPNWEVTERRPDTEESRIEENRRLAV
jgi:hypothetical protein